jgi:hypothetical protein
LLSIQFVSWAPGNASVHSHVKARTDARRSLRVPAVDEIDFRRSSRATAAGVEGDRRRGQGHVTALEVYPGDSSR